jgi:hypothetical protein
MSSYHYGPTGERIEDDDIAPESNDSPVSDETPAREVSAPSKWRPEPGCTDAWNDYNNGENCPHGVLGGLDLSRFGHTRCVDCGGRRRKFKRRLTGRHPINHDRIKSAWTRDAA